ncbi:OadG family protein [Enterococcus sp.]|uniref:OadG family protein n=1 Tax=Enterococcus sp. TaxID=35783 RepID=UPI00290C5105|nr:OadG family protein [Enterococcus sp.]MDU5335332.1 OadG family protein [Enterococcus sp.]
MQYSIVEILRLTIFSMAVVFLILTCIMLLIMGIAKIFATTEDTSKPILQPEKELDTKELFEQDPLAKVAAITALAEASEDESGKKFKISTIKRVK